MLLISVVSAARNEQDNLPAMYERLVAAFDQLDYRWEWLIIDDHSTDGTAGVIRRMANEDSRIRGIRLSRNFGSHAAALCGLHHCRGDAVVMMASDLQDPPEMISDLIKKWEEGFQVVRAMREKRLGESWWTQTMSRLYHFIMRSVLNHRHMPPRGASFRLLDRVVVEAIKKFGENASSVSSLLSWMGFRTVFIPYDQQPRLHGKSNWTLKKKIELFINTATTFSPVPIHLMSIFGLCVASIGFLYAAHVFILGLTGRTVDGWASLMVVTLLLHGVQMVMIGALGIYLWRTLSETRRRPQYLVEEEIDGKSDLHHHRRRMGGRTGLKEAGE